MTDVTYIVPMQYDGHQWTSIVGALYPMPPEQSKVFNRDLMGDCDVSDVVKMLHRDAPYMNISFKGGMTFEGRPLWVCEIGWALFRGNQPVIKSRVAEASDKASALQKCLEEVFRYMRDLKYRGDNGLLCG